ncbi:MAG: DUF4837 family protein [Bacteroidaceae bacterium]|nr:DUF4837 family protein [Bacteroidaceae bacterium]
MKKIFAYLLFLAVVINIASCDKGGGFLLPASSGRMYEVLVVMDKEQWEHSPAGRALFDVLDTDVPGLPQSERSFRINQVNTVAFKSTFRLFRNIIIVNIDKEKFTQTKMKYERNVFSDPQVILTIQSPNQLECAEYIKEHTQEIIDFFVRIEFQRTFKQLRDRHNERLSKAIRDSFDCDWWIPVDMQRIKKGKDFIWISNEMNDLNLVIYSYPYTSKNTFTYDYFVHKRDSVMRLNIPGTHDYQYMATDTIYVVTRPIVVKHQYAYEGRGLWEMENDAMGGPFVSHSRVDTINNRIVVVEGFVYDPAHLKREKMRRLEAVLYTLRLPAELEKDKEGKDDDLGASSNFIEVIKKKLEGKDKKK